MNAMMKKTVLALLAPLFVLLVALSFTATASAEPMYFAAGDSSDEACRALRTFSPDNGSCVEPGGTSLNRIIALTVHFLSLVAGIIGVIMLIIGGLKFVTSNGDSTKASSARSTIIYAVVGLMIVLFAQILVRFVFDQVA